MNKKGVLICFKYCKKVLKKQISAKAVGIDLIAGLVAFGTDLVRTTYEQPSVSTQPSVYSYFIQLAVYFTVYYSNTLVDLIVNICMFFSPYIKHGGINPRKKLIIFFPNICLLLTSYSTHKFLQNYIRYNFNYHHF